MHSNWPLVGWWEGEGQHRCKSALRGSTPSPSRSPPPLPHHPRGGQSQAVTAGLTSLQVAAYGGKLRYTLSYTSGAQGSPLSDPDVQITVSTWIPCQVGGRGSQGAPSVFLLSLQSSRQLAWHRLGVLGPCPHLCIWLDTTQAESQLPGEGGSGHVPDSLGTGAWKIGERRGWNLVENPTVPKSLLFPLPTPLVSPQGNNIMLVASQPALQGPERKRYEIVFREVRDTRLPCFQLTPPPLPWSLAWMPATLLLTFAFSPRSPLPVPGRQELGDRVGGCRSST